GQPSRPARAATPLYGRETSTPYVLHVQIGVPRTRRRLNTTRLRSQKMPRIRNDKARYSAAATRNTSNERKVSELTMLDTAVSSSAEICDAVLVPSISSTYWLVSAGYTRSMA